MKVLYAIVIIYILWAYFCTETLEKIKSTTSILVSLQKEFSPQCQLLYLLFIFSTILNYLKKSLSQKLPKSPRIDCKSDLKFWDFEPLYLGEYIYFFNFNGIWKRKYSMLWFYNYYYYYSYSLYTNSQASYAPTNRSISFLCKFTLYFSRWYFHALSSSIWRTTQ